MENCRSSEQEAFAIMARELFIITFHSGFFFISSFPFPFRSVLLGFTVFALYNKMFTCRGSSLSKSSKFNRRLICWLLWYAFKKEFGFVLCEEKWGVCKISHNQIEIWISKHICQSRMYQLVQFQICLDDRCNKDRYPRDKCIKNRCPEDRCVKIRLMTQRADDFRHTTFVLQNQEKNHCIDFTELLRGSACKL